MKNFFIYEFHPAVRLFVAEESGKLTDVRFKPPSSFKSEGFRASESSVLREAKEQLLEYFAGKRRVFDLPISLSGTDFELSCWEALRAIPYAKTQSYAGVARAIGRPRAFRAVGGANHRNPVAIIVPCHRVVGSDGSLVGFGGGLDVKKFLLDLERSNASS
jgi:methylated-DNA-[protein]-cysteine S-methyltransferase